MSNPRIFRGTLQGVLVIERRKKGEKDPYQIDKYKNALTAFGKDLFLDLIIGLSNEHYDNTAVLQLTTDADSEVALFSGTDQGPNSISATQTNGSRMEWQWEDNTTSQYTFRKGKMYNGTPGDAGTTQFNSVSLSSDTTKSSDENWTFKMQVELFSSDTDIQSSGTQRMMQLMSGQSSSHWVQSDAILVPKAADGTELGTRTADSGFPAADGGADLIAVEWTSPAGEDLGDWDETEVRMGGTTTVVLRDGGCQQDGTSCGTKQSGDTWTYRYEFRL